jgi:hypothetical protein
MTDTTTEPILDPDAYDETPPDPPPRKQRKRKKKGALHEAEDTGQPPLQDLDAYMAKFDWDMPEMRCKLERKSPGVYRGVKTAGFVGEIAGRPFTQSEIQEKYGGEIFIVRVVGPKTQDDVDKGVFWKCIGYKQVTIPGPPKLHEDALPQQDGSGVVPPPGGDGNVSAQAQSSLVNLTGKMIDRALDNAEKGHVDAGLPSDVAALVERTANARVQSVEAAANKESQLLREQMNEMREELTKLRVEKEQDARGWESKVSEASNSANSLLTTLFPAATDSARQQVQDIVRATDAQVQRVEARAAADVSATQRHFEQQLANQQALFQVQMTQQQTMYESQLALLRTQLEVANGRSESYEKQNLQLRDSLLLKVSEEAKNKDPLNRMEELQTLMDVAKGFAGGGGDDLPEDASAPERMIARLAPVLQSAAEAYSVSKGGAPQMTPQMAAQQQAMMQQQAGAQFAGAMQQAGLPGTGPIVQHQLPPGAPPPQPAPPQAKRLSRVELEMAVQTFNDMAQANPRPDPAQAAAAALSYPDYRDVLVELTRQRPEHVLAELDRLGMLRGTIATEEGKAYAVQLLRAMKTALSQTVPAQRTMNPPASEGAAAAPAAVSPPAAPASVTAETPAAAPSETGEGGDIPPG